MIFLNESALDSVLPQDIFAVDFRKETASVHVTNGPDQSHTRNFAVDDLHDGCP
jgi:hypothetical protein